MKILITNISFYPAHEGGPTNALYWLASGLAKSGYNVRVVTTNRGISTSEILFDTWVKFNGFEVIYVKTGNWRKILKEELYKSDVFVTSGVCTLWGFYIRMKALSMKKKVIISPRGELFDSAIDHKGDFYGFLKRVFFLIMRICYNDGIIYHATSEEECVTTKKIMKTEKVFVVPNLMILPERVITDKNHNPYFLYVGRINPIKALDKLIKALSISESFLNSNYTLKIAGETKGDYYESLKDLVKNLHIEDKIEFLGVISDNDLNNLYANARWLFLLSNSENFGNVVIEALCQSTPVVASKGTPWSILEDNNAGFWIDNSPSSIALVIDNLLNMDSGKYEEIRDNAYRLSQNYNVYSNMQEWVSIIES